MNNTEWIESYTTMKPGAYCEYKPEWEVLRLMIRDKMFGMIGHDNEGRSILTLKLAPNNGVVLRDMYTDIRPGYYMNKTHWNSVDLNGAVPKNIIEEMIDESYELILGAFSKKARLEILEEK